MLYLFIKRYIVQSKIGTDSRRVHWKHSQAVISKTKLKSKQMFTDCRLPGRVTAPKNYSRLK